jgi:hypothetical protein
VNGVIKEGATSVDARVTWPSTVAALLFVWPNIDLW